MKRIELILLCTALLSGCVATRPFHEIESELDAQPVRATFPVPPPCEYIASPDDPALIGTWSVSGMMDGVDYSSRYVPPHRWSARWSKSFTFSADGGYSVSDSFNGKPSRATGRWSYRDGRLILDIARAGKTNTHREYRLLWIDDKTFDLRWSSDAAEAAWWKEWVLDRGSYAGWDNSVVVTHDRSGCKRQTSRMRQGKTGVIYDVIYPPLRYRRTGEGRAVDFRPAPTVQGGSEAPLGRDDATPRNRNGGTDSVVEIDSIPL